MNDEIESGPVLLDQEELKFFINICMRCDMILGSSKVKYTSKGIHIEWFFGTQPKTPLMCNDCLCLMCDECRDITEDKCMEQCKGKFVPYQLFTENK